MGNQLKPDIPTLIKRISKEAHLPSVEESMIYKFSRSQLVELYVFISELKKTNSELINKVREISEAGNKCKD